jgi:hypothetical protein
MQVTNICKPIFATFGMVNTWSQVGPEAPAPSAGAPSWTWSARRTWTPAPRSAFPADPLDPEGHFSLLFSAENRIFQRRISSETLH